MKRILLFLSFAIYAFMSYSQVTLSPNTACQGQTITVTISGINYSAASSGCGALNTSQAGLTSGSNTTIVLNPTAITGTTASPTTMTFTIPANFSAGVYGFNAEIDCAAKGSCSSCFTVLAATSSVTGTNTICAGGSTTLTATGGGSYLWSTGQTTAAITVSPASTTTYNVTVTNPNGCQSVASRTVTVNNLPNAQIQGNNTICTGSSTTLTAGGGVSYSWNTGQTTSFINVSPNTNTNYSVTVTGANGCTNVAQQLVTVNSLPNAQVTGNNTICQGASTTLTASGGSNYLWSTGQTTAAITVSPANNTTYSVTVTNSNNCSATASQSVTVNSLPNAQVTGPNIICPGTSATLTASGGNSYAWSTGETTAAISVQPNTSTNYTVTVTSNNNCTATANTSVNLYIPPNAQITDPTPICQGQSTSLTASGGNTYLWSTGETTASINVSPNTTTTYTVTVADGVNCTAQASEAVTVNSLPNAQINGPTVICTGLSGTLTASGGTSYSWSTTETTASINVSPASSSTYTVTVTDANGCSASTSQNVSVSNAPVATISGDTIVCLGQSVTLTANGGNTYTWGGGETTSSITVSPTAATTYTVTASLGGNCTADANTVVNVKDVPAQPAITVNGTLLTTSGNTGTNVWYLNGNVIVGETQGTYTATQNGNYSVQSVNECGPSQMSPTVNVIVNGIPGVMPSVAKFFPNPVTNNLTVINMTNKEIKAELFGINGALISTTIVDRETVINMSQLAAGVYHLRVISGTTVGVEKIVKQ